MTRTQIQLPDELYRRAKRFAQAREWSLAEVSRRALELWLERYPEPEQVESAWELPRVNLGGLKARLEDLKDIAANEETRHGLPRESR